MSLLSDALARLGQYNLNPFKIDSNPFGLTGTGGTDTNLEPMLGDVVTVGQASADNVTVAADSAAAAAGSAMAAGSSATAAHASEVAAAGSATSAAGSAAAAAGSATAASGSAGSAAGSASSASTSATLSGQYANAAGGSIPSVRLTWDTATADADPGNGKVRANNATPSAATALYVDNLDASGASITTVLDRWTASTNTTKGTLRIAHRTDATKWLEYQVTGTVVDGTGYRKITLTGGTGPGGFAAGDPVAVGFCRAGDMPSSFAAGTTAAPGWAVTGDSNTGLAQPGGADSLSMVAGGAEVFRTSPNAAKVYGAMTVGDRGDGFGSALTLTPGVGPDWHVYSRVSDGALVFYHFKNKSGGTVAAERMVLRETGIVDFSLPPTVNGSPIASGMTAVSKSSDYTIASGDSGSVIKCTAPLTLTLPAASGLQAGWVVTLSNRSTGSVPIARAGSDTVSGLTSFVLRSGEDITVYRSSSSTFDVLTLGRSVTEGQGAWNPSAKGGDITLTNSNLTASSGASLNSSVRATIGASSGKRYCEFVMNSASGAIFGLMNASGNVNSWFPIDANGWGYFYDGGRASNGGPSAYGSSLSNGSIGRLAVDLDAGKLFFGVGSVWQGSADPVAGTNPAFTGVLGTLYPAFGRLNTGTPSVTLILNLSSFNFAPPTGYTTFY